MYNIETKGDGAAVLSEGAQTPFVGSGDKGFEKQNSTDATKRAGALFFSPTAEGDNFERQI